MFPCSCSQLNIEGRFQDDKFILAPIFEFGKILCHKLNIPSTSIIPGSIDDRKDLVKRPKSMALSNAKLTKAIGNENLDIEIQIMSILKK